MILLMGGASEMQPIASALAEQGLKVLVSTATDFLSEKLFANNIEQRIGLLDARGISDLIRQRNIVMLVDATHPYAVSASKSAEAAASECSIPYFRFRRPLETPAESENVLHVSDHVAAAQVAFSYGVPVLLTTGSRNLTPYTEENKKTGVPLFARVLPVRESIDACISAGIPEKNIITGKGPFAVEENVLLIESLNIGVLVTKDSGEAGGVHWKIEAAEKTGCRVVVVLRPTDDHENTFEDIESLVEAVAASAQKISKDQC